jgi:HTH-type transcriptional regulator/antitoxin HigA
MDIFPIKTENDYRRALAEIEGLMAAAPDTPEGDRLDVLVTLVEAYEARHYPMDLPNPIEAIRFRMEQVGLRPKDMASMFGAPNRFHEVMKGSRPLTLQMIRRINAKMGIPAEVLIQEASRTPVKRKKNPKLPAKAAKGKVATRPSALARRA